VILNQVSFTKSLFHNFSGQLHTSMISHLPHAQLANRSLWSCPALT